MISINFIYGLRSLFRFQYREIFYELKALPVIYSPFLWKCSGAFSEYSFALLWLYGGAASEGKWKCFYWVSCCCCCRVRPTAVVPPAADQDCWRKKRPLRKVALAGELLQPYLYFVAGRDISVGESLYFRTTCTSVQQCFIGKNYK